MATSLFNVAGSPATTSLPPPPPTSSWGASRPPRNVGHSTGPILNADQGAAWTNQYNTNMRAASAALGPAPNSQTDPEAYAAYHARYQQAAQNFAPNAQQMQTITGGAAASPQTATTTPYASQTDPVGAGYGPAPTGQAAQPIAGQSTGQTPAVSPIGQGWQPPVGQSAGQAQSPSTGAPNPGTSAWYAANSGLNPSGAGPANQSSNPYTSSSSPSSVPYGGSYQPTMTQGGAPISTPVSAPNLANGTPDYMNLANQQSQYNQQNAQNTSALNNPNFYGPNGAQVRTRNADGSYSVTQSLSPELQHQLDQQNSLNSTLGARAGQLANREGLNFNGAPNAPTFNTDGVNQIPTGNADDLNAARDSVYNQSTQYLDPQFKQAQSDMESKLANQGIMPGSDAYNREVSNFNLQKQKAYGDARNSAIQAGGAEQSRLFGLGLQSHTTGMNDALAGFNTGLQGRQQGVSEQTAIHNSPINDISALRGLPQVQMPTYQGQTGVSIPGVDYLNAANMGYNANLGVTNANNAASNNNMNGLFGLGGALINSGSLNNGGWLNGLFGGGSTDLSGGVAGGGAM